MSAAAPSGSPEPRNRRRKEPERSICVVAGCLEFHEAEYPHCPLCGRHHRINPDPAQDLAMYRESRARLFAEIGPLIQQIEELSDTLQYKYAEMAEDDEHIADLLKRMKEALL